MVFRSVYNGKPVLEEKSDEKGLCMFYTGSFFERSTNGKENEEYFDRVDNRVSSISDYGIWKRERCFSGVSGSNAENSRVRKLERRTGYGCRYDNYPGKSKNENESYIGCSYRGIWL